MSAARAPAHGLTVLVVDDSAADRRCLSGLVQAQGHAVLEAATALEAVSLFRDQRPQLVLMGVLRPLPESFAAARRIKALAGEHWVPIIFLMALDQAAALASGVAAGGDDFLEKPCNALILAAKITAMDRLRRLQETVLQQRDQIARHNDYLLNEQRVARAVFDQVAHSGCLGAPNIDYRQSPYALFNGDLLLAAYTPTGDTHLLLADFTGHGLPAAIGAMPLAEVFYSMTAKGYGLPEMLREMNAKLKRILAVDMFCCAILLCISAQRRMLEVWNGGMPDGYLLAGADAAQTPLVSQHLPLGVLRAETFDERTQVLPLAIGDRLLLLSDGVIDTCGEGERLFGVERLQQVLVANHQPQQLIAEVERALNDFRTSVRDDVSLVQVSVQLPPLPAAPLIYSDSGQSCPLDWSADFEFCAPSLKRFNPLPYLLGLLMEVHGLRSQAAVIHTVLAELYSNALEHGVLGLDSRLKRDASGFVRYYQQRVERLEALSSGFVRIYLQVRPQAGGGRLLIRVEDSGQGFDVSKVLSRPLDLDRLSGRGLSLVRQLCPATFWTDNGCSACVEFSWAALA